MSQRGILEDHLGPAWSALTAEERVCWHFTAAKHPERDADDLLFTENGWQFFIARNALLAVVNPDHILQDAPTTETLPNTDPLVVAAWPLAGKLGAGGSARRPPVTIAWGSPGPADTDAIITQEYTEFVGYHNVAPVSERITGVNATSKTWITTGTRPEYLITGRATAQRPEPTKKTKNPSVRHVTAWQEGDPDEMPLDVPVGYYATTAGNNRFALIRGQTARRRPDLPLARVTFVNRTNGKTSKATIPNPTGGSPRAGARPRHQP